MLKRTVFIGIALIVVALVLFAISGEVAKSSSGPLRITNLTVAPESYSYTAVTYSNNASAIAIYAFINKPANIYVLNGSAFSEWSSHVSGNVSGIAYAHEIGVNSSYIVQNKTLAIIPLIVNGTASNSISTVYVVVDNTNGSPSSASRLNVSVSHVEVKGSAIVVTSALSFGFIILIIAGIIVLIYGLVKKPKAVEPFPGNETPDKADRNSKEYIDNLYKVASGKRKRGRKAKRR